MSRTYKYNRVMTGDWWMWPKGALLTDKELAKSCPHGYRQGLLKKVRVPANKVYIFFGVRFCEEYRAIE